MQPLLEPAVLLSENCESCRGTGWTLSSQCSACDGAARQVREVPLSEVFEMARASYDRLVAPPPSQIRAEAGAL